MASPKSFPDTGFLSINRCLAAAIAALMSDKSLGFDLIAGPEGTAGVIGGDSAFGIFES